MKTRLLLLQALIVLNLDAFAQQKNITVQDLWGSRKLSAITAPGFSALNDGLTYSNTEDVNGTTAIIRYNLSDGKTVDTILKPSVLTGKKDTITFSDYTFSKDEKLILLTVQPEHVYRNSILADYYLYDRQKNTIKKLTVQGKVMYCTFSPDGKQVAYVRSNNLYVLDLTTMNEVAITTDGKHDYIINGAVDWVYEEEFTMSVGFQWSPDGKDIAYYRFDESAVKEFSMEKFGELYPAIEQFKYPKAGEINSKVEVYVYHSANGKSIKMNTGNWEYLPRIQWTKNAGILSVQRANRHQNILEMIFCDAINGESKVILRDTNSTYIEITDDLTFLDDGKRFIWTSSSDGYNHIYLYGTDGKLVKQVTTGKYDVTKYYGYSERSKTFYYQSAEPSPMERRVNAITLEGKKTILTPATGTHDAEFTSGFNYFVDTWSAFNKPYVSVLCNAAGKQLRVLENNEGVNALMKTYALGTIDSFTVKTPGGILLYGWMIKPVNFDPAKKYPVLQYIYGGPGVQAAMNEWGGANYIWHQMLAEKGYIVACVDNRGTIARGIDFSNCIYKDMGNIELQDQLTVTNYLKTLPYVNGDRVGIWGWSFGGYLTSLLMTKGNGIYKAGIAVAPVTNWRFYDSIYTERYLQTPQENSKGYDDNSPIYFAKNLQGKFLLVHGSGDDNVHYQNTMEFINALVKAGKQFDLMIYPNRTHNITGNGARFHLYTKMTDFILQNL